MSKNPKLKIYFGTKKINDLCVSCFTAATSKKIASKIFNCSTFFREKYMTALEIKTADELDNSIYKLALEFPQKIFVKNCKEENENYRLFINENIYTASSKLITNHDEKLKFLDTALNKKQKFIKLRIKDEIVLKYGMSSDLYLDISSNDEVKRFFFIPFSEKLIDENWQHRAIETNHDFSYILNEMADVYDEVITPYSVKQALDFIKLD